MSDLTLTYSDEVTGQLVEHWAAERGFAAKDQLSLHFEQPSFDISFVHVAHAEDRGDVLILQLTTDRWQTAKEFGLSAEGSLFWQLIP